MVTLPDVSASSVPTGRLGANMGCAEVKQSNHQQQWLIYYGPSGSPLVLVKPTIAALASAVMDWTHPETGPESAQPSPESARPSSSPLLVMLHMHTGENYYSLSRTQSARVYW